MDNIFWKNKKILITGVHGFVGSNLCKYLIKNNATIFAIHKNNSSQSLLNIEGIENFNSLSYNNLNLTNLIDLVGDKEIEICFHLAAQVEVKKGYEYPYYTFDNNINLTLMILESLKQTNKMISMIFTSTDKVYGDIDRKELPYVENYIPNPKTPYEVSKLICEKLCIAYAQNYNIPIVITRACNLYGPGQMNFSAIIPNLIMSALNKNKFIPRSNGKLTRDYLYIEDWIKTLLLIAEKNFKKPLFGEIFNFGTNDPKSVIEIAKLIYNKIDPNNTDNIIKEFKKFKSSNEIINQTLNSNKAIKFFDFKKNTDFETGLKKTIEWYTKYLS